MLLRKDQQAIDYAVMESHGKKKLLPLTPEASRGTAVPSTWKQAVTAGTGRGGYLPARGAADGHRHRRRRSDHALNHRQEESRAADQGRFAEHLPPGDLHGRFRPHKPLLEQVPLFQTIQREPNHLLGHGRTQFILENAREIARRSLTIAMTPDQSSRSIEPMNMAALFVVNDGLITHFLDD